MACPKVDHRDEKLSRGGNDFRSPGYRDIKLNSMYCILYGVSTKVTFVTLHVGSTVTYHRLSIQLRTEVWFPCKVTRFSKQLRKRANQQTRGTARMINNDKNIVPVLNYKYTLIARRCRRYIGHCCHHHPHRSIRACRKPLNHDSC